MNGADGKDMSEYVYLTVPEALKTLKIGDPAFAEDRELASYLLSPLYYTGHTMSHLRPDCMYDAYSPFFNEKSESPIRMCMNAILGELDINSVANGNAMTVTYDG